MTNESTESEGQEAAAKLPTTEEFLLKVPLYDSFAINDSHLTSIHELEFFEGTMDAYCVECKQRSTFFRKPNYKNYTPDHLLSDRAFSVTLFCSRDKEHKIIFYFLVRNSVLTKVGQHPSIADFYSAEIGKYRKILGNKYKEFSRAIGLTSHGVGIGAFVYLRRIFEGLIEEAHVEAQTDIGWDEELYAKGRMEDKILLLQDRLPPFLVENRSLYGILSKGIHSLTEKECLELFEPMRVGIELILDEKIEQEQRRTKIENARRTLAAIKGKLS